MALPTSNQNAPRPPKPPASEEVSEATEELGLPPLESLPSLSPSREVNAPSRGIPSSMPAAPAPLPTPAVGDIVDANGIDAHGMKVDPNTGIKYKPLPKSTYDAEGFPVLQNPDFDADNLNAEAEMFLGHLRVAPSKAELLALREERAKRLANSAALENNEYLQQGEAQHG